VISIFLSGALGAFFGIFTGSALEWWKSEREDLIDICRGFCALVAEAADVGAEFWLTSADDVKCKFMIVRLAGFQNRISAYGTILIDRVDDDSLSEIQTRLAQFFVSLTGGDADDPKRKESMAKAIVVHDRASAAIIAIRQAMFQRVSFSETFSRWVHRRWPNRGSPTYNKPDRPFEGTKGR